MTSVLQRWVRPRAAARDALVSVASEPWLVTPEPLQAAFEVVRTGAQSFNSAADIRAAMDIAEGERTKRKGYFIEDRIAVIAISGLMMREVPCAMSFFGVDATSTVEVQNAIARAVADDEVDAIFLDIDSPGGTVAGTAELGDAIAQARAQKPVHAHASDLVASAAYWVTAQASRVTAGRTANVGSIGVYKVLIDSSKQAEDTKVTVHRVASGPLKGVGVPGVAITEAQLEVEQEMVDRAAGLFREAVIAGRPALAEKIDKVATGRTWFGKEALELGLIDALASRAEAFEEARRAAGATSTHEPDEGPSSAPSGAGGNMSNPKAATSGGTTDERLAALEQSVSTLEASNKELKAENAELIQRVEQQTARAQMAEKGLADRRKAVLDRHQARGAFDPADRPAMEQLAEKAYASDPDALDAFLAKLDSKDHATPTGATGANAPGGPTIESEALELAAQVGLTEEDMRLAADTQSFSMLSNRRTTADGKVVELFEKEA